MPPPLGGSFTKLGPRVPTFVVSPLVERGGVIHDRFDHTSIGATILRRFCGRNVPSVSPRMNAATDLRNALTRADSPRLPSEFQNLGLPPLATRRALNRSAALPAERVGPIKAKDDFHGMLAAVRLITGQPPRTTGALRRKPQGSSGELLFYRDQARFGTGVVSAPAVIGRGGWQQFTHLFSGGNGLLYAVDPQGSLFLYRDRTQDGTGDVANPVTLAQTGWQDHKFVFSGGEGIIYAVDAKGRLLFHRHRLADNATVPSNPAVIGLGGSDLLK